MASAPPPPAPPRLSPCALFITPPTSEAGTDRHSDEPDSRTDRHYAHFDGDRDVDDFGSVDDRSQPGTYRVNLTEDMLRLHRQEAQRAWSPL